jgi:hypothetical protein
VDVPGRDGRASMPEQVKGHNAWRKMMMMIMIKSYALIKMYISTLKYLLISARIKQNALCVASPEDDQVMLGTRRRP